MTTPLLSLVLCSRNDAYMGNSRWRLETTLNYIARRLDAIGRSSDVEVLVTDWGSDVPLRDEVSLVPAARDLVSFVTVPRPLARRLQRDSPFPEVLALNAAVRRARGAYVGRIDQDTLVGERFLRWFFDAAACAETTRTLYFSNRRDIPYRIAVACPPVRDLEALINVCGNWLPVWRDGGAIGKIFWTGNVGIWLAHRAIWECCGGYDERLIYYNWMEADMIGRLRQRYPMVDLGAATGYDFYHLEHVDPRTVHKTRRHAIKNTRVDPLAVPPELHPNCSNWGLAEHGLPLEPSSGAGVDDAGGTYGSLIARFAVSAAVDRPSAAWSRQRDMWVGRAQRLQARLAVLPALQWPSALVRQWGERRSAVIRRASGGRWIGVRRVLTSVAGACGSLAYARRLRTRLVLAIHPDVRRLAREDKAHFVQFDREFGTCVAERLRAASTPPRTALVVSSRCPTIEGELCIIKSLELAGFAPIILLEDERCGLRPFYERAGVGVRLWSEFISGVNHAETAAAIVDQSKSIDALMTSEHRGVRIGMNAVCTTLRRVRVGVLDLAAPGIRDLLVRAVAASLSAVDEAERILDRLRPALVLSDHEYTPKGELFETCLNRGLEVVAYSTAHRSDALMLKRYTCDNRDDHLTTLARDTWTRVQQLEWTDARRRALADEIRAAYVGGDWFQMPWRQPNGDALDPEDVRRAVGIDPAKKTAFLFPHVLWDAPVLWGKPLFDSYQEWWIETIARACRNTHVNWVIKVHPDHVWKHEENGYRGEATEIAVVREQLGALPPHIAVMPPETPISTLSLFSVMDYCVTVRGTVGVEAAAHGIPVLTAGAARYAQRGFTIDSATRSEYLAKLSDIHDLPPLSVDQRQLAERFAYGLFMIRPLPLTSIAWDPSGIPGVGSTAHRRARLRVQSARDWREAKDVAALAGWLVSHDEDFVTHVD